MVKGEDCESKLAAELSETEKLLFTTQTEQNIKPQRDDIFSSLCG